MFQSCRSSDTFGSRWRASVLWSPVTGLHWEMLIESVTNSWSRLVKGLKKLTNLLQLLGFSSITSTESWVSYGWPALGVGLLDMTHPHNTSEGRITDWPVTFTACTLPLQSHVPFSATPPGWHVNCLVRTSWQWLMIYRMVYIVYIVFNMLNIMINID